MEDIRIACNRFSAPVFHEAIGCFENCLKIKPDYGEAMYLKTICLLKLRRGSLNLSRKTKNIFQR